ncbi:hypothetical protein ACHAWO_000975 [Cyclotella atomus]|uniref:Ubiquitin-like domain-containing protein n=1 Tax=Cyclotella atomus TaxID=382360 RepID=A0ABD3QG54_9STRA
MGLTSPFFFYRPLLPSARTLAYYCTHPVILHYHKMSDQTVEIVVIRSSDGKQATISIPSDLQQTTLHTLKDHISSSSLGPIKRNEQRLFHLGKEIKSGNRSLDALGIGRFNVFSLHLHSLKPKEYEIDDDDEEDDDDEVEVVENGGSKNRRKRQDEKVVDLLESESDSDVEVVEVKEGKRRKKNEITID